MTTEQEHVSVEMTRADVDLLADLLDIHIGTMRTAAARAKRNVAEDERWTDTARAMQAEVEQSISLRNSLISIRYAIGHDIIDAPHPTNLGQRGSGEWGVFSR